MNVTKDVILDLLPLYQEGEVSADTRRLVEEFLSRDAELKAQYEAARGIRGKRTEIRREVDAALETMEKTKAALRYQKVVQFYAILFTLGPLSFAYSGGEMKFLLLRDQPLAAAALWCAAGVFWFFYWRTKRVTS